LPGGCAEWQGFELGLNAEVAARRRGMCGGLTDGDIAGCGHLAGLGFLTDQ
jgi:hypothetical protein